MVVFLGDRILRRKPQILLRIQREIKTCLRKTGDGLVRVVDSLQNAGAGEIMDRLPYLTAILRREDKLRLTGAGHLDLRILIHIPVSVTGQGDRLLPVPHTWLDPLDNDGRPEHRAVQSRPDRAVGAFPHLFQVIFCHSGRIGRDRRTFYRHTVLLRSLGAVKRHLVIRLIAVLQSQVVILCLQIDIRQQQLVLDHFP